MHRTKFANYEEITMNNCRLALRISVLVSASLVFTSIAQAQATRTWVSGVGDDVNPCSRTAPCKTFAGAISKTAMGGEINALDSGGFGTVLIKKSITLDGTGTLGGILAAQTTGIFINITDPNDTAKAVRIRGLSINGAGNGSYGIRVIEGNSVSVEDTVIDGFTKSGIGLETGQMFVSNTTIRNNAEAGINLAPRGAQLGLSDVNLIFNGVGLIVPPTALTSFSDVVLYGNKSGDTPAAQPTKPAQPRKRG
jgi:parallel beta helix pectate lyase-like protein